MEEPSQFSLAQTTQSLTCSIMERPHSGLDYCLKMLLACFRKRMSDLDYLSADADFLAVTVGRREHVPPVDQCAAALVLDAAVDLKRPKELEST